MRFRTLMIEANGKKLFEEVPEEPVANVCFSQEHLSYLLRAFEQDFGEIETLKVFSDKLVGVVSRSEEELKRYKKALIIIGGEVGARIYDPLALEALFNAIRVPPADYRMIAEYAGERVEIKLNGLRIVDKKALIYDQGKKIDKYSLELGELLNNPLNVEIYEKRAWGEFWVARIAYTSFMGNREIDVELKDQRYALVALSSITASLKLAQNCCSVIATYEVIA